MSIHFRGIELKYNYIKPQLKCQRTKLLFNIPKFIPDKNLWNVKTTRSNVTKKVLVGFYDTVNKLSNFHIFPVIHATRLTDEQIAELRKKESQIHVSEEEIQAVLSKETGMDRLRRMVTTDQKNDLSPDMQFVWNTSFKSGVITYLVFYILKYRDLRLDFERQNRATVYETNFKAGRRIRDTVNLGALKHGLSVGSRVFLLVFSALFFSQAIAVYRCKTSVWEYIIGTGLACSLNRFTMGPKGMISGFVFGSFLGIPIGIITYLFLTSTESSQEQRHYWNTVEMLKYEKKMKGEIAQKTSDMFKEADKKPVEKVPDSQTSSSVKQTQ